MKALGMIEIKGFSSSIETLDACLKAADVKLLNYEANFGCVTIKIEGDVGAVQSSIQCGIEVATKYNTLISSHVIAKPDSQLIGIINGEKYMGSQYAPVRKKAVREEAVREEAVKEEAVREETVREETVKEEAAREEAAREETIDNLEFVKDEDIKIIEENIEIPNIIKDENLSDINEEYKNVYSDFIEKQEEEEKKEEKEEEEIKEKPKAVIVEIKNQTKNEMKKSQEVVGVKKEKEKEKRKDCNYICALCDDLECPDRRE